MIEVKYNCRTFLNKRNQIVIRVRWNKKKSEVGFSVGMRADPNKWNADTQRPQRGSTHIIGKEKIPSRIINERIDFVLEAIKNAFGEYALHDQVPSQEELKELVNEKLGRNGSGESEEDPTVDKSLEDIFKEFLCAGTEERNWTDKVHYKYEQVWKQLTSCDPNVTLDTLDKNKMIELKKWFVKNKYRNRTARKQFRILKSFLRWMKANGYPVHDSAIDFKHNLKEKKKNVTYLTFDELMKFFDFEFPENQKYLDKARDLFCFMAFTSLRYSDLAQLKKTNITSKGIDLYTVKTSDHITININDYAQKILDKYSEYKSEDGRLFPVPSAQKINDYIKMAAKQAGLEREVVEAYYIGDKRYDEVHKFYEIIGCHDARRTFVCCSLALGIPATTVMKWTGHKDYESMKPYIEINDDTLKTEMEKWNGKSLKHEIIRAIDKFNEDKLKKVCEFVNSLNAEIA